jgi:hypothetical protein
MARSGVQKLWLSTIRYRAIALGAVVSILSLCVPLQHYITLGRYQHYGLAVFLFGMGYVIQTIWSWNSLSKWVRISYVMTGIFFCSVGCVFWTNTWLDSNVAVQTEDREYQRNRLLAFYVIFGISIVGIWAKCVKEEGRMTPQAQDPPTDKDASS